MKDSLKQELLEAMGYETKYIRCDLCHYHKFEVDEKCGFASLCRYNNIGYIEASPKCRCKKFKRKTER